MIETIAGEPADRPESKIAPTSPDSAGIRLGWGCAAIVVVVVYVWYVSVGYWTWWPKTTYTYDLLGSALRAGQLSLQQNPDPALLALPDPYDPAARANFQYPWDASLYNGRFYLYWGPTPGLILAFIKLFYSGQIADQYLVFAFVFATYLFGSLLLLELWKRYFVGLSASVGFVSFLALGLAGPATWLLNRPAGYEAAITGGQAFLAAGLFFAVTGVLSAPPRRLLLMLAGISWALAVASRIATAFPIAIMTIVVLLQIRRHSRGASNPLSGYGALLTPMVAGAVGLAWYNWARFGSIAEFGLRYQLTLINLHAVYAQVFSLEYVADNLRNYLLNSVAIQRTFPFLIPLPPAVVPPGPARGIPTSQLEPVTGLLFSAPYLVYALLTLAPALAHSRGTAKARAATGSPTWLYIGLWAAAAVSFFFVMIYFYPTERQLDDVVPLLGILAVLGLWEGWRTLRVRPLALAGYGLVALALVIASIASSSLLAVTSYENRFQHLNRELLRELIRFFGR